MVMVAPFAAGGSTDAIARIVADGLHQLHQPVVVENIGGRGMTGANRVAGSKRHQMAISSCSANVGRTPKTRRFSSSVLRFITLRPTSLSGISD